MCDSNPPKHIGTLRTIHRSFLACCVIGVFFTPVWLFAALLVLPTLVVMFLAAHAELGAGYATRHTVLAVVLSVIFLGLGMLAVPILVDSDIAKARAADRTT